MRTKFESKGEITDINVNKDKRHAIIGYKEKSCAEEAIRYFDKTFINTNKINVILSLNSDKRFQKYSKNVGISDETEVNNDIKEEIKQKKKKKLNQEFEELTEDPDFDEFIRLQRNVDSGKGKHIWSNDMAIDESIDEINTFVDNTVIESKETENNIKKVDKKPVKSGQKIIPKEIHEFTVKMRGLPYKVKKRQIKEFFDPLKPLSLRLPPKVKGIAYVSFHSSQELSEAMVKHRGFLDGHRIELLKCHSNNNSKQSDGNKTEDKPKSEPKWKSAQPAEESVGESGRIYIRNLSYATDENQLKGIFEKFGPLAEFHLPIDSYTKKQKGFAFVTFVFPEHAVKALAELDKSDFQGRLIHLIPAKAKPDVVIPPFADEEKTSFKKQKQKEKKSEAQSSHQWNTLFINANTVADIMAKKFNIKKSELLADSNTKDNIAVRMALGETQIVNEMRRFLLENGVHLKAFNETNGERSKNTILVKNLPANTKPQEIRELFEKYGLVLRVILPPNGVTAIVEMQETNEAKTAFNKLAYNNFKHFPLYLEWAPENVFRNNDFDKKSIEKEIQDLIALEKKDIGNKKSNNSKLESNETQNEIDSGIEPEEDTTLFVKNLNFDTTEEDFRDHFKSCGQIFSAKIAYKMSGDKHLSMGYGFIQFVYQKSAQKALKQMQHSVLDGHTLELKISNRTTNMYNSIVFLLIICLSICFAFE